MLIKSLLKSFSTSYILTIPDTYYWLIKQVASELIFGRKIIANNYKKLYNNFKCYF